ncbi:MAG: divergent polysaccharide deacetylase family protein [Janthinobacterium lividum]
MASDPAGARAASLRERLTWRRLGVAWAALAVVAGGAGGVLQWLGPPPERATAATEGTEVAPSEAGAQAGGSPGAAAEAHGAKAGGAEAGSAPVAGAQADLGTGSGLVPPHDLQSTVVPNPAGPALLLPSGAPPRHDPALAAPGLAPGAGGERTGAAWGTGAGAPPGAAGLAGSALPGDVASGGVAPGGMTGGGVAQGGVAASGGRSGAPAVQAQDGPVVIAAPLAALLEPGPDGLSLPRVGADGLAPMRAYARPTSVPPGAKLVAIVLDGIGLSEADSLAAINDLPGAVDLAVSAYAAHPDALLARARLKGHELLASIPMEPAGSPLNDEGGLALTADAAPDANEAGLARVLGRIQGYAGVTGGSDGQRGEHFALSGRPFAEVMRALAARGLLYIDAAGVRPPPGLASLGVDLVVDEPAGAASLDARLARLEAMAQESGAALGLAGPPRPVTVERLAAWASGLAARGLVLVPASALVRAGVAAEPGAVAAAASPGAGTGRAGEPSGRRAP